MFLLKPDLRSLTQLRISLRAGCPVGFRKPVIGIYEDIDSCPASATHAGTT